MRPPAVRIAATLALAALAGAAAQGLHVPLPWMIGPLLVTAAGSVAGAPLAASNRLRNAGQWLIGTALGLYFTPPVLGVLATLAPAIALGVAWALALGFGFYRFLWWSQRGRDGGLARSTAFFAAAIGGASEMAVLAERAGAQVDRVAAAHSLRVLLVVVIVPFTLQALDVHGADLAATARQQVHPAGLAVLLAASAAGGLAMRRLGAPNPWVLGALAASATLTGLGLAGSALPRELSNAAQLAIAVALGTRFTPTFVHSAPRWLAAVAAGTLAMLAASAAFGAALAGLLGLHPATLVLATAPGGIAEVAITASVLGLGVPVVTAFQVARYVAVLTLTGPLFRWLHGPAHR
ncbi:AbrB family transcriptional regulator [Ideonella sp. A 288]|uniref:AbrB family transcriptional regulator n=1 Tax=Ideonella sp. A 288 TaxID=1962181 RepID=UPI001F30EC8D|nr:AbrB family transcriptional regulator [Ideonella sp. A 288]